MPEFDIKAASPDTSLPSTGFLFGADSQASANPSIYSTQTVATALLGSTSLTGATETTSKPLLDLTQTWNAGAVTFTGLRFNAAGTSDANSAADSLLMDLQVGGVSRAKINKAGQLTVAGGSGGSNGFSLNIVAGTNNWGFVDGGANALRFGFNNNAVYYAYSSPYEIRFAGTALVTWAPTSPDGAADLTLRRRAAANLQLGAADAAAPVAQTLSVQSVVAGTSNTAGTNFTIDGSQGTGTGAGGSLIFRVAPAGSSGSAQNALSTALTIATTAITAQNHLLFSADNTYDIGASGATRPRDLFLGRNLVQVGAYHEMAEMTAPAAPATNSVRIYAEDNGSSKTRLMARFATGAAVQIAIEP
jgi:hypothetical protein